MLKFKSLLMFILFAASIFFVLNQHRTADATVLYNVTFPNGEKCEFTPPEAWDKQHTLLLCYTSDHAWATNLDSWSNPVGYYYTDWGYIYYSEDGVQWQNLGAL